MDYQTPPSWSISLPQAVDDYVAYYLALRTSDHLRDLIELHEDADQIERFSCTVTHGKAGDRLYQMGEGSIHHYRQDILHMLTPDWSKSPTPLFTVYVSGDPHNVADISIHSERVTIEMLEDVRKSLPDLISTAQAQKEAEESRRSA